MTMTHDSYSPTSRTTTKRPPSPPCALGFGTVRECPNLCRGECGYKPTTTKASPAIRNDLERAYLTGQRDALAQRRPEYKSRDGVLCALYLAGYDTFIDGEA